MTTQPPGGARTRVVSLFSGIGGGDLGLQRAGLEVRGMCEVWAPARRVLQARFPGVTLAGDVREFSPEGTFELLSAGFPCNDLSHAGKQVGIFGEQSGLVSEIFRIAALGRPEWVLIENVPNLLRLHRGAGIALVTAQLEALGYRWAYRVVDSRAFGVPQRRHRVVILAGRTKDPAPYLLGESHPELLTPSIGQDLPASAGFYWTEGRRGVGLVSGAIPTLKGGSTIGIPSSPAVWLPHAAPGRRILLPSIGDGELLQGFERDWTAPADMAGERSHRWKLVGNAITVGLGEWIGNRLHNAGARLAEVNGTLLQPGSSWPQAAFGSNGQVTAVQASRMPLPASGPSLLEILDLSAATPLSPRAISGFLSRVNHSGLRLPTRFRSDLEEQMELSANRLGTRTRTSRDMPTARASSRKSTMAVASPEGAIRRALTRGGVGYRLRFQAVPTLRWMPTIVMTRSRVAVDLRGCFLHSCTLHRNAGHNRIYWDQKRSAVEARDRRMVEELAHHGWRVLIVWEHDDPDAAVERVLAATALPPVDRTAGNQTQVGV